MLGQVFRIKLPAGARERGRLVHRRDINQVDYGHMSLNCIRYNQYESPCHFAFPCRVHSLSGPTAHYEKLPVLCKSIQVFVCRKVQLG